MKNELVKKCISGLCTPILLVLIASAGDIDKALHLKIIIACLIGFFASVFQPAYSPIENRDGDEGTALQIVWSVFLALFISMVEAMHVNYPVSMSLNWVFAIGLSAAIAGIAIRTWAFLTLKESFTWFVHVEKDQELVDKGPYRWIAHPSYTGALMIYTGIPLMFQSYFATLIAIVLLTYAFYRRIVLEESVMLKQMGDKYTHFLSSRKRLFPGLW